MKKTARGFTLIESMVTIALIVILTTIAVPAYRHFTASNRAATEINTFVGDLQYARMAAIQNGTDVTMCVSSDGKSCKGSGDWTDGWIVFMDTNNDQTVETGETRLRVHEGLTSGDTLTGTGNTTDSVTYNRFGMLALQSGNNTPNTVTLRADPDRVAYRQCVTVTTVGAVQAASGSACQ